MFVEKIEFAGFEDPPTEGPSHGSVVLVSGHQRVQIPLTLPYRVELSESRHRLQLLITALRMVRRFPHYRRRGRLRFAPGVLPPVLRTTR